MKDENRNEVIDSSLIPHPSSFITPLHRWHLATLEVARRAEEFAASLLFDLGTNGIVTLEENDASVKLGAYFDERIDTQAIREALEIGFAGAGFDSDLIEISFSSVEDQDWMQKWKEGFEPVEIGERLLVAPSWKLPAAKDGRLIVQIDPGMAFGTGTHETTRLCLEAIELHWHDSKLLDVGTGTGILAIAAALLRPESRITAIDIDPLAVEIARENVEANGVSAMVEVIEAGPRDFAGGAFDVVVANLTAEVIISLMDDLTCCFAPSGTMILSGILSELRAGVEQKAVEAGLMVIARSEAGEWSAIVARRGEG